MVRAHPLAITKRMVPISVPIIRVGSRRALLAAYHRGRVWEPSQGSHYNRGGEGIRTLGALLRRYGFQDRRLRPLGHSSGWAVGFTPFGRRMLSARPPIRDRDRGHAYRLVRYAAVDTTASVGAGGTELATGIRGSGPRRSLPRRSTGIRQSTATEGSLRNSPGSPSARA